MKPAGSFVLAFLACLALAMAACGATCSSTVRTAAMPVIAAGSFDGVVADQGAHRIYLADRTTQGVDVVDMSASTPRFAGTIALGAAPNGLAFAPDQHRLYAGTESGEVAVIDTGSASVLGTMAVGAAGAAVDLVDYSPKTKSLYVGSDTNVVVVDTVGQQVTKRVDLGTPVEQPRYDPADGMLYVTAPKKNALIQIDPASGKTKRTYVMPKCGPKGVAINPTRQLAMLACGSSVAFVNLATGAHDVTRVVQGGDIVTYDPGADVFVVASPHDTADSAVGVFTGGGAFVGSVAASPVAHAAVYDDAHGVVYAPGKGGLMSFAPAVCAPPPDWLRFAAGLSVFAVPLLAAIGLLVVYAWTRQRRRNRPSGPTYDDLVEEDLAFERERMRVLEEGMFGPEAAP